MSEVVKWRELPDGTLEGIDAQGFVVERSKPLKSGKPRARKKAGRKPRGTPIVMKGGDGKNYVVPVGTSADSLPTKKDYPYSETTARLICSLITEGKTIKEIGLMEGFPGRDTIFRWKQSYPEFREAMNRAVEDQAYYFFDEIVTLSKTTSKDTAFEDRLKFDIMKWAAKSLNKEQFGEHVKHQGTPTAANITIVTGVPQAEVEVKSEVEDG